MKRFAIAAVISIMWALPAIADYATGVTAYQRGDYATEITFKVSCGLSLRRSKAMSAPCKTATN
jgi:hypothetical protein